VPDARRTAEKLSAKEIAEESKITTDDVQVAREWWRSHAPAQYKELLDAEEKPDSAE
jgi:hypothetical protein